MFATIKKYCKSLQCSVFVRKCSLEKTLLQQDDLIRDFSSFPCNPFCLQWHIFLLLCSSGSKQLVCVREQLQLQLQGSSKAPVLLDSQTLLLQEELRRMKMGWLEVLLCAGELPWLSTTKVSPLSPAKEQQPGSCAGMFILQLFHEDVVPEGQHTVQEPGLGINTTQQLLCFSKQLKQSLRWGSGVDPSVRNVKPWPPTPGICNSIFCFFCCVFFL